MHLLALFDPHITTILANSQSLPSAMVVGKETERNIGFLRLRGKCKKAHALVEKGE